VAQRALVTAPVTLAAPADRRTGYLWRRFRRNRLALAALAYLLVVHLVAALAPRLAPHPPEAIDLLNQFGPRSREHPLGTDETGRDVLSRLIFGARTSLAVGLAAMAVAMTVGSLLGAVSGFYGGVVDAVVMRVADG
jgi:peptide/nickel transport system permease protein